LILLILQTRLRDMKSLFFLISKTRYDKPWLFYFSTSLTKVTWFMFVWKQYSSNYGTSFDLSPSLPMNSYKLTWFLINPDWKTVTPSSNRMCAKHTFGQEKIIDDPCSLGNKIRVTMSEYSPVRRMFGWKKRMKHHWLYSLVNSSNMINMISDETGPKNYWWDMVAWK